MGHAFLFCPVIQKKKERGSLFLYLIGYPRGKEPWVVPSLYNDRTKEEAATQRAFPFRTVPGEEGTIWAAPAVFDRFIN